MPVRNGAPPSIEPKLDSRHSQSQMSGPDIEQAYSAGIKGADQKVDLLLSSATLKTEEHPNAVVEIAPARTSRRIPALDFTKGALVLIMVLYHWTNYFVMVDGSVYKYLRFLTPSFIFITGFLISQVYLSKYQTSGSKVPGRLLRRGIKLLAIVVCLNLVPGAARLATSYQPGSGSIAEMVLACAMGTTRVAFSVLIPIAYLLILSAGLLIVSRHYRNIFHATCALSVACALLFELKGIRSGYLQLVSIGMLGITVGYISIDRINRFVKRRLAMVVAYLAYLTAITLWDDSYALQIAGVCLSLAIIYWLGVEFAETSRAGKVAVLLGQYSLFAYIAQIVILQILRRGLGPFGAGIGGSGAAFVGCLAGTVLSVEVLDRARPRIVGLNRAYTAVFG